MKRNEILDMKRTTNAFPEQASEHNLIDIEGITKRENPGMLEDYEIENIFYLERIVKEEDKELPVYPYCYYNTGYPRPYLTPQRHWDYSLFWGCTAGVGFSSILFALFKR